MINNAALWKKNVIINGLMSIRFLRRYLMRVRIFIGFLQFLSKLFLIKIKNQNDFFSMNYWIYKIFGTPLFNQVMIQTNYCCTRKCSFCYYGLVKNYRKETMQDDLFFKIIRDLSVMDFKGKIGLFEINEPLTDKDIVNKVKYAVEQLPNAWHEFITNGDLANKEKLLILSSYVNSLSFTSYDKKASKRNQEFVKYLKGEKVKAEILHTDFTSQFVGLTSRGGNVEKYVKKNLTSFFCEITQNVMMITPSGDVLSCWNDFFHENVMGNVNNQSLKEVWFSDKFTNLRKNLSKGNRKISKLCIKCDYEGINEFHNPYRQIFLYEKNKINFIQKIIYKSLSKRNNKLMLC